MTEATIRNILGLADMAADDLVTALAKMDAVKMLIEGRAHASDIHVLDSAIKYAESARFRYNCARHRLQAEAAKEAIFVADHAGQDAQDALR